MTRFWKGKRILSLLLALALIATNVPLTMPITAASSCPVCGSTDCAEDHGAATSEENTLIGKQVKFISSYPWLWTDPNNTNSQVQADASKLPKVMVIVGVHQFSATTTLYQLDAAEGYTWPAGYPAENFTGKYWAESTKVTILEPCDKCGKVDCGSDHKNWCEICKVDDCDNDHITATVTDGEGKQQVVTVAGKLPEGAELKVTVPEINGEKLPNVFDIKIYDKDGNEWQPIDEGRTVKVSIPVSNPRITSLDVIHLIDYAPAVHTDVQYLPLEGADAETLASLADAIKASNIEGYVAAEVFNEPVIDGKVEIETNSFSVYKLSGHSFVPSENQDNKVQFSNFLHDDEDTVEGDPYYATPETVFDFVTANGVTYSPRHNGVYFNVREGQEYVTLSNERQDGDNKVHVTVTIDPNTPAGTSVKILFATKSTLGWFDTAILKEIIIVRPVEIKFDANLPADITASGMPDNRVFSELEDNRVITDGNLAQFNIPSNIPTAKNIADDQDTYTFLGWNTSPAGDGAFYAWNGSAFDPVYFVPTKDITLYAMWKRSECKVTFDHNNGTGTKESINVDYNGYVSMPKEDPERPGYVFLGWSASEDGSGVRYKKGDSIQVKSDVILYALWGIELRINAIGGTVSVQRDGETKFTPLTKDNTLGFDVQSSTSGGVTTTTYYIVVPENAYSKAYFRFIPDASNKTIRGDARGSEMEFLKAIGTDNLNGDVLISEAGLTQYTVITFTAEDKLFVSFDSAGGSVVSSQLVSKGNPINLELCVTTRDGYDFVGWYDANGDKHEGNYIVNEDMTFTARWTPKKFHVTVNAGYGIESVTGAGQYDYSSAVKVTATMKPGYSFGGWTSNAVAGSANAEYTFLVPNGNVNLTAYGELINYKINYVLTDANGITGTNHADNPATYTIESGTITLKNPTAPTNYKFVGWKEGSTIVSGSTGEKTFTAMWEPDVAPYTVEIYIENVNDDNYSRLERLSNTGIIGTTVTIDVDNYTNFIPVGFAVSEKMEHVLSGTVQADGSLTLKVYIDRNRYTVTGIMDGVEISKQTVKYGAPSAAMEFVPVSGYAISSITVNGVVIDVNVSNKYGYTYAAQGNVIDNITVEVKTELALAALTISVGCDDPDQVFIFRVQSVEDGVDMKVTVTKDKPVTICGVTIGKSYTVSMESWPWRYTTTEAVVTKSINAEAAQNTFTFDVTCDNDFWLDGNDYFFGN